MDKTKHNAILGALGFLMMMIIDAQPLRPEIFHYPLLFCAFLGLFCFTLMISARAGIITNYWDGEKYG